MSKVEIIVYLLYLVFLFTLVYILFKKSAELYNSDLKSKDRNVKYKTDQDIQDIPITTSQQSMKVPTPHLDQIDYTYFNSKHKRNLHNIGNEPQSPTQTYNNDNDNKTHSHGPSCGCKMR